AMRSCMRSCMPFMEAAHDTARMATTSTMCGAPMWPASSRSRTRCWRRAWSEPAMAMMWQAGSGQPLLQPLADIPHLFPAHLVLHLVTAQRHRILQLPEEFGGAHAEHFRHHRVAGAVMNFYRQRGVGRMPVETLRRGEVAGHHQQPRQPLWITQRRFIGHRAAL